MTSSLGLRPPAVNRNGHRDLITTLTDPWYRTSVRLYDVVTHATYEFCRINGYTSMQLPITTRTVTCPSAWGSDSDPVDVVVNGSPTFLSDSAQFLLEYAASTIFLKPSARARFCASVPALKTSSCIAPSRVPPRRHFTRAEIPPSVRPRFSMYAMSKPLRVEAGAPFVRPWAFRLTPEMSKAPGHPRGYSRARGGS